MSMEIKLISLNDIFVDEEWNCRGVINKIDVADLAKDISAQTVNNPDTLGLLNPITIRVIHDPYEKLKAEGRKYSLVAGFRRYFAFKVLDRPEIPCIVKENMNIEQAAVLNISENLNRKDLNVLQESLALKKLKDMGIGREHIAKALGVSGGWVQVRFNLLDLPEEIQKEAAAGVINHDHIKKIYSLKTPEKQFEAVRKIKDAKLRGDRASDIVITPHKGGAHVKKVRTRPEIFALIDYLSGQFGYGLHTRVLGWAAGEVTDYEVCDAAADFAKEHNIDYTIPANGTFVKPEPLPKVA